jgi:phosphoglycolate phosphatase-like HAD superfamily hydrolase
MSPTPLHPAPVPSGVFSGTLRRITHAVFDFDGTLSWLRHGWPEMMLETFAPYLPPGQDIKDAAVRERLLHLILALNGKPTIQQMVMFQEYAHSFGVVTPEPEMLRQSFQALLDGHIKQRTEKIKSGALDKEAYVVAGARGLLEFLRSRGVRLYVLSSTIEHRVREEAELLGLTPYFEGRIFGSPSDPLGYTKRSVFERILREEGIDGGGLLAVGDGPVEIADAKALGGMAIAVCTDEEVNGSGIPDPFKENQLLAAGADVAIPDFRDAVALVTPLLGV